MGLCITKFHFSGLMRDCICHHNCADRIPIPQSLSACNDIRRYLIIHISKPLSTPAHASGHFINNDDSCMLLEFLYKGLYELNVG